MLLDEAGKDQHQALSIINTKEAITHYDILKPVTRPQISNIYTL